MTRKLIRSIAIALATGAMFSAYGKSFSLDLRRPRQGGARAKLLMAAPAQDEGTLRSFDLDAGAADVGAVALGDELTFALFDDVTLTLVLKEKLPTPLGGDAFLAEVAGYEGIKTAVVLRTVDGLTIDVQDFRNRKYYKVLSTRDGVKVQEVEAKGGACGCDTRTPDIASTHRSARKTRANVSSAPEGKALLGVPDGGAEETFVDILVAFDGGALSWARKNGGGLTNFAQTAVQKMNLAIANTGLDASFRFRLVGVVGVAASSTSLDYVLSAACYGWDGWDAIGEKRERVGADIVTVLVDTGSAYGTTGLGYSLSDTGFDWFSESAYNACAIRAVAQSHTMTHEVGHNMGCGHSDVQYSSPGPQLYDYSAGYYFSAGGEGFHTIMAYDGQGPRGDEIEVPYFSSPKHKYRGVTVGNQTHDNTRTLANTFAAVAKWRAATRAVTEEHGGYEWTANIVEGGCIVMAVQPAPAGAVAIPANIAGFDVVGFDEMVFQDNLNITSVSIPATVRDFDGWSFYGSRNLTAINVDEANENLLSKDGVVYDKSRTTLICCPPGVKYLDIPGDISAIGDDACVGLWNVKEIYIPANVTSIGLEAFAVCNALTTVVISEEVTEIDEDAFSYCPKLANAWLPADLEYGYMEYDSFYKQSGHVSLHYYFGSVETFSVCFDPCDPELDEVYRTIPSIDGKVLMAVGALPEPTRPNYAFLGWFTEPDGGTKATVTAKVTGDVTYYAHWLSFAVNGEAWASAETPMCTNVLCGVALRWSLAASALSGAAVKVAGLPAGLKFTAKDIMKKGSKTEVDIPANTIYGAPSAASKVDKKKGVVPSEVKITVTTGEKSSVTYLLRLTVDPLPAWAVGGFEGFVGGTGNGEWGTASMSVTAAGKISGKIASYGTNWTFKADSFAGGSVATNLAVDAVATAGKASRNIRLNVVSFPTEYIPDSATARAEGSFGDLSATLFRLPWADKGDADVKSYLSAHAGSYTCKVPYGQDDEGEAKFTFDEKGVAKGTVVLPDGAKTRKVSFASSALTYAGSIYIAIYTAPDAKKGYPAVFDLRQLCEWSGPDDDAIAYRDPGVLVTTEERNKGSGASGTVTMNPKYGQAAAGKDVTLTAKPADKNSVFSCWVVAGADTAGLDLTSPTIKLKANGTADIDATAQFVTREEDQGAIMLIVDNSSLYGEVNDPGQANVEKCVPCGVVVDWAVRARAYSQTTIKADKLPAGLKLVQDKATKTYSVAGVPTKAGTFPTRFTVTTAGKSKETVLLPIEVKAMPADIVGSYTGMIGAFEDPSDDDTWRAFGMVTLSVAANGKLSAKATLPSGSISFSANGWDSESNGFYRVEMSTRVGDRLLLKLDSNRDWKGARIETPDSVLETAKGAAYLVVAWRNEHGKTGNIAADKTASDFIARIVALKKLCFKVTGDAETGYTCDEVPPTDKTSNLTLTFDAKGNVKYSGKIGGKTISGTSVLNVDGSDYYTIGDLVVPLSKTEALYLALGFDRGGNGDPEPDLVIFHVAE